MMHNKHRRRYAFALALTLILFIAIAIIEHEQATQPSPSGWSISGTQYAPGDSNVTRSFSTSTPYPGDLFTVDLEVVVLESDSIYAVEEYIPLAFTVIDDAQANATTTNATHTTLKWLYFSDTTPASDTTITYTLQAPASLGTHPFDGIFQFENTEQNTSSSLFGETQVTIQNALPVVQLTNPSAGATITGHDITFMCSATDDGNMETLELWTNSSGTLQAVATGTGDGSSQSLSYSESLPYGVYEWQCVACDAFDCTTQGPRQVTLQNDAPSTSLTPPSGTVFPAENLSLNCTATDPDGVDNISIEVDGLTPASSTLTSVTGGKRRVTTYQLVPEATYSWNCSANDSLGLTAQNPSISFTVDLSPGAYLEETQTQVGAQPVVDGTSLPVRIPISTYNFEDIQTVTFAKPIQWVDLANPVMLEDGVAVGTPTDHNATHYSFSLNGSKTYELNFTVDPPSFVFGPEVLGDNYSYLFNVTAPNHFTNVTGNLSINKSYTYYDLYWMNGTGWQKVSDLFSFTYELENGTASFTNLNTSNQSLNITGESVCSQEWECTDQWSACVNNVQTRICSCPCEDDQCVGSKPTRSCTTGDSSPLLLKGSPLLLKGSPLLLKGSSPLMLKGEDPLPTLKTDIFTFPYAIYRAEVTYNDTETIDVTMSPSTVVPDQLYYGVFDMEGTLEIMNAKLQFHVPQSWIEANNINTESIKLYQQNDDVWAPKITSDLDHNASGYYFESYVTTLGTFAILAQENPEGVNISLEQPTNETNQTDDADQDKDSGKDDAINFVIYLVLIVIMIGGLVVTFYLSANRKTKQKLAQKEEKKIEELKSFIKQSQDSGMSKEQIRTNLVDAGWNREIINIYLK